MRRFHQFLRCFIVQLRQRHIEHNRQRKPLTLAGIVWPDIDFGLYLNDPCPNLLLETLELYIVDAKGAELAKVP